MVVSVVLSGRGLCDGTVSSRGAPSSVVCVSVIEEPHNGGLCPLGLSSLEGGKTIFELTL